MSQRSKMRKHGGDEGGKTSASARHQLCSPKVLGSSWSLLHVKFFSYTLGYSVFSCPVLLVVHEVLCSGLPCFFPRQTSLRQPALPCSELLSLPLSVSLHTTLTWQPFPVNPYSSSWVAAKKSSGITTPAYLDCASFLSC